MKKLFYSSAFVAAGIISAFSPQETAAQNTVLEVTSLPAGFTVKSVEIGLPINGAAAPLPHSPESVYIVVGDYFSDKDILRVNIITGTFETVATLSGSIGGMAVLSNGDLILTENQLTDAVYRARDLDNDGKFFSQGEITVLLAPENGNFTGAQTIIAPPNNASAIPEGSLLIQTADGGNNSKIYIIADPESESPVLRPVTGAYYSGFEYNGGIDFDVAGNLIVGISEYPVGGKILALVNSNGNETIEPEETGLLLSNASLPDSISDLTVSSSDVVFFGGNSGTIKHFPLPENRLSSAPSPTPFLETNSGYISVVGFLNGHRPFAPFTENPASMIVIGNIGWDSPTNFLLITPEPPVTSAVLDDWSLYH